MPLPLLLVESSAGPVPLGQVSFVHHDPSDRRFDTKIAYHVGVRVDLVRPTPALHRMALGNTFIFRGDHEVQVKAWVLEIRWSGDSAEVWVRLTGPYPHDDVTRLLDLML